MTKSAVMLAKYVQNRLRLLFTVTRKSSFNFFFPGNLGRWRQGLELLTVNLCSRNIPPG